MENISTILTWLGPLSTALGIFLTWFYTRKVMYKKLASEHRKETKVNDVEGDTAILNQMDSLMERLAKMSEEVYESRKSNSALHTKIIAYESAYASMLLACSQFCADPEFCKEQIAETLKKYGIHG
jgi:hypothetical protein